MEPQHILRDLTPAILFDMKIMTPTPSEALLRIYILHAVNDLTDFRRLYTPSTRVTAYVRIAALALTAAGLPDPSSFPAPTDAEKTEPQ